MYPVNPIVVLAISVIVHFNVPADSCDRYEQERNFTDGVWSACPFWENVERTIPKRPRLGAGPDSGWIYVDDDWRSPVRWHVRRCLGADCSDWSNDIIASRPSLGNSVPATYFLLRPDEAPDCFTEPRMPQGGLLLWALKAGDHGHYRIVTQAAAQAVVQPTVCTWPPAWRRAITCP